MATSVKVGDKVSCNAQTDVTGVHLANIVRDNASWVIQVGWRGNPNHIIISLNNKQATAVVDISTLTNLTTPEPLPEDTATEAELTPPATVDENAYTSEGIEDAMAALLDAANGDDILKYSMKLFGIPHQFTHYCDYRAYTALPANKRSDPKLVGRKFIENIMLEAPVITIIPGKPVYMPASTKKFSAWAMVQAANGNVAALAQKLDEEEMRQKLRYYDFEQDYFTYMEYVNIMCQVGAAFLDIGDYVIDGTGKSLRKYDWKDYRWNNETYRHAGATIVKTAIGAFIDALISFGKSVGSTVVNFITGNESGGTEDDGSITALNAGGEDKDFISTLEDLLANVNYVQFYVDSSAGVGESANNQTTQSKLAGVFDAGNELLKEVAFIANSGGLDSQALQDSLVKLPEALADHLASSKHGSAGGILQRLLESSSSVIKGEKMIFPEIYMSSSYQKNYSITVDLRAPDGNKLSYYLNILVPLFHIMCLAIPKQGTANTYSAPFLVRCYYPGVFSCNLGIVESIQIDRPGNDTWTIDNLPNEMKVTINIKDLYSDMSMSPRGDVALFLSNSSLIEYIATNCGVNLVTPQLRKRVELILTSVKQAFSFEENLDVVSNKIWSGLDNLIDSIVRL